MRWTPTVDEMRAYLQAEAGIKRTREYHVATCDHSECAEVREHRGLRIRNPAIEHLQLSAQGRITPGECPTTWALGAALHQLDVLLRPWHTMPQDAYDDPLHTARLREAMRAEGQEPPG